MSLPIWISSASREAPEGGRKANADSEAASWKKTGAAGCTAEPHARQATTSARPETSSRTAAPSRVSKIDRLVAT
jgi:hypothetical protein